jgi:D-alanyl-D-alanine carboxypeptidase
MLPFASLHRTEWRRPFGFTLIELLVVRRIQRDRRRRGHRRLAFLVLAGCIIIGAGAFCITQAYSSLSANISLIGKAAIVYDLTNGQTLYAQNAYTPLPLASITKLLTVYAASNVLQPNSVVTMTPFALAQDGNAADVGFRDGETFNFEDIARLTLAASSNVGAEAIAEAADSAENTDTASLLSTAAQQAGLAQTQALNATGLDNGATVSGSYGSAHDVAVLAGELLKKDPQIAAATTQSSISITSLEGTPHSFANTNVYLRKYPGLLLSKTGYTDRAGGNLVIVSDLGTNHPVAIVVLGATKNGRFTDVSQLMAATLAHFGGRERRPRRAAQGRDEGQPPRDARRHRRHRHRAKIGGVSSRFRHFPRIP